ncbi:MAG: SPOR domain-containing protein [Bacteroidia bacterium]|nr:SPOR domain-containing protein [Bacteroidia bacterium]MBT8267719.1 SPOR domain-containing protein [Bacteroidia bacterium]NNF81420.1 SPOR domain-containing protein [Flavobacteriaceae bacterium]NNK69021.1 SPOR domain-containing protein [Flavobacteriaceae bacterium]NNL79573.1 SPOR domain-containing protein [Flavobacteriaceae bacterium]
MNNVRIQFVLFLLICFLFSFGIYAQNGVVEVNQDPQIDELVELKKDINRREKNFKIQIYNGNRSGAENARRKFEESYSGWSISMEYETPNYKIWVGNFRTRLEADRALLRVKRKFANAFIFRPKKK